MLFRFSSPEAAGCCCAWSLSPPDTVLSLVGGLADLEAGRSRFRGLAFLPGAAGSLAGGEEEALAGGAIDESGLATGAGGGVSGDA